MIPITYNDFFQQSGHGKDYSVNFKPATRSYDNFFQCVLRDAEYIWENRTGRLKLLFSGGIDSEYMLNAFRHLGLDFDVVIIRLQDYNTHDIKYATEYCSQYNIPTKIINFNFDQFVSSGQMLDVATKAKCSWHQIPATLDVILQLDGNIIMASNDPHLVKKEDDTWWLDVLEYQQADANWFIKHGIDGTPFFMGYSAETFLSFLLEDSIVNLVNNRKPGKLGTYSSRIDFYGKPWAMKDRTKYTGYELIERSNIFNHPNMLEFKKLSNEFGGVFKIEYKNIVNMLKGNT